MMRALFTSRRGFLLGAGGVGAALCLGVRPVACAAGGEFRPSAFIRLEPDGSLLIACNRAEMGQGVRSTLPALIAAELGADIDRVIVTQAPGDAAYGDQNTDGSTSVRAQFDMLRRVGAVARVMLLEAAAARWGVDPAGLRTEHHQVLGPTGAALDFGALAEAAAALPVPDPDAVSLRPDAELARIGGPLPFVDAQAYVTGAAAFGADISLPGQVVAVVLRPPDLGATLSTLDDGAARAVRGVLDVITLPPWRAPGRFNPLGGVAVVAEHTWAALQGRAALRVAWAPGAHAGVDSATEYAAMEASVETSGSHRRSVGDADKALLAAARTHGAVYRVPHLAHAPMEPPAALVWRRERSCEVWAPVQNPQLTRKLVAKVVGLSPADVTVNVTFLGGGFGRKSKPDFVLEAAYLSMALRVPVRVQWTREDDLRHGYYHSCAVQRLDAGFDAEGAITAWRHRVAAPSIATTFVPVIHGLQRPEIGMGLLDLPLDVPHHALETHVVKEHVRIGWLRSVHNINHAFAVHSFVDELAHQQGVPTPDLLKRLLGPPRHLTPDESGGAIPNYGQSLDHHPVDVGRWHRVIDRVRALSAFDAPSVEGRALGFAAHASFNSYVALVVAVSRDPRGGPRLDEAWIVLDAGTVLNPDRVTAQMEGAVIFGASIALYGDIHLADGAVVPSNVHEYRLLRISEAPAAIHVDLHSSGGAPGGVGEPGVPPVAPALANAWFALTGERVRALPFRPRRRAG